MDLFDRYAPFIQDFIYENGWENLRAIQAAAGDAIFNTDQNVLLCASTASGKTEAAFFPILTLLTEDPPASVGCIYVAPLKALINDQFLRLNDLCREAGIPVWHWHGDVSASEKKRVLKKPSGILQITPESLEALLMHKHANIPALFGDLRFVVIDEIHAMLRGDRGGQTLCLIERLSRAAGVSPRRIGLSATIGDPRKAGAFLSAGSGRGCIIPRIESRGDSWRLSMEHFYKTGPQAGESDQTDRASHTGQGDRQAPDSSAPTILQTQDRATDQAPYGADPGCAYVFEHTKGKKCLVFSNSREECEEVTTTLRQYCERAGEPDRFLIHHGNLATSFRQSAEEQMKDEDNLMTICTTSTLELGIDIGRLERAFQMEAPFTVSSFLQRMGRTGRRGDPCEMWFVMREDHAEARDLFPDQIPWALVQGIALVQLYLEERWVEPPRDGRLPYSLLYHQTMATLASGGEMTPSELASRVLSLAYFSNITAEDYKVLLRHLLQTDQIQWTEEGGLIVGLAGERITNSYKFYAVFQENEEYTVRCESEEIGTIVNPPPIGDRIAIAGHVWVCEEVDRAHHLVYVHMIKGNVPAYFGDEPGDIHTKILERMARVLSEDQVYPYLKEHARARLAAARAAGRAAGIAADPGKGNKARPLICLGDRSWCLFPWLGSYAFLALERFLRLRCKGRLGLKGFNSVRPYFIQFTMDCGPEEFFRILREEAQKPLDPLDLVYEGEVPLFDKYDDLVPEALVRKGFACGVLDIEGMKERIFQWAGKEPAEAGMRTAGSERQGHGMARRPGSRKGE